MKMGVISLIRNRGRQHSTRGRGDVQGAIEQKHKIKTTHGIIGVHSNKVQLLNTQEQGVARHADVEIVVLKTIVGVIGVLQTEHNIEEYVSPAVDKIIKITRGEHGHLQRLQDVQVFK